MYIHPIIVGVAGTLLVEVVALVVYAIIKNRKG